MTLSELLQRLEQRARDAERLDASAPVATVLRAVMEDLRELNGEPSTPPEDRGLTAKQLAERMGVSRRYVYQHAAEWPFTMHHGRAVRFSLRGYLRWRRLAA